MSATSKATPPEADEAIWIGPPEAGRRRVGLNAGWLENRSVSVVALELLPVGATVRAGDTFGFLHTPTDTLDLRASVAMHVVAVNGDVLARPRLVELAPHGRGWLIEIEDTTP
jgi:glycine cleavage system H protein